ncbi:D-alanyl-D-alanine carboxypeptidase family protein [Streptomyces mayteni]
MPFNRSSSFTIAVRAFGCAALATLVLASPARADEESDDTREEPPEAMSTIGGERLGRPGTQVGEGPGVPELPEDLTSRSWIVADAETGDVLAAHNSHWPLAPASTLKMLFADTLLPEFERDATYRAEPEHFADMGAGSSAVGIADGQTYRVEDLWHGVFLASGNDAVYALTAMNGGKEQTVAEMNDRAEELQANDTHVVNPDGYDAEGQLSSAYDLTLFARSGMQNEDFREYVSTPRAEFPGGEPEEGEDRESYEIQSTNRLLVGAPGLDRYEGLAGVKNGYTSEAGHTFTGVAERDGRVLLVTALAPEEDDPLAVYRESAALLDWGFAAEGLVEPVGELVPPLSEATEPGEDGAATPGDDDKNGTEEAGAHGAAGSDGDSVSGLLVLGVTAAGLVVLAAGAYVFHRRHPLPQLAQLSARRSGRRRGAAPRE